RLLHSPPLLASSTLLCSRTPPPFPTRRSSDLTPASYGVGEMANLSAEALNAARIAKTRRDDYVKMGLAELYERMFRLAMHIEGHESRAADLSMEIVWADTDPHSIGMIADAFGKMADQLGVPVEVLWEELPNMTPGKLKKWLRARERE